MGAGEQGRDKMVSVGFTLFEMVRRRADAFAIKGGGISGSVGVAASITGFGRRSVERLY